MLLRTHFNTGMSNYGQLPAPKPAHQCCFTALHCIPNQEEKEKIYYSKINLHWSLGIHSQGIHSSEMAIIQYSSLSKFSDNITEQETSSFKSSEIQLPQERPRTLYSEVFCRVWKSSTTSMITNTMSLGASLMHTHTQIPKQSSRWILPQLPCCNYFQH